MKITKIVKMGKEDKFAVFVDDKLSIILNGQSLLDSGVTVGMSLTVEDIAQLNKKFAASKLYNQALKYISIRIRSENEVSQYLKRRDATPEQISEIKARLRELGLINDDNYARAFIHDRMLASPASKRKITYELRKKQVAEEVIERSLQNDQISDLDNLAKLIEIKRRQPKFHDDLKLMQYLVRIGFNYGDVKNALGKAKIQD